MRWNVLPVECPLACDNGAVPWRPPLYIGEKVFRLSEEGATFANHQRWVGGAVRTAKLPRSGFVQQLEIRIDPGGSRAVNHEDGGSKLTACWGSSYGR